jgi:hypothetical protein
LSPIFKHAEPRPEDTQILEIARSLTSQLGIDRFEPQSLNWLDTVSSGKSSKTVPSDQCLIILKRKLVLAHRMIGKLTPEQWKPILASSIVYEKNFFPKLRRKAVMLGLPGTIAFFAWAALSAIFIQVTNFRLTFGVFGWIPTIALLFVGFSKFTPYQMRARLQADREASQVVGREEFLDVLEKIDSFAMPDAEQLKADRLKGRNREFPSITERIESLRNPVG